MRVLAANVEEVFREAAARLTLVAYAALSSLFIGLFAIAVNLDVVDGALAGAKLFGRELQMGPKSIDLDKLVLGFESGFSGFLYVVATFLAVFATAHLVPRLQEKGTIDLYLSRPVGRVRLLLSRYVGGLLLAGLNVAYLIGSMGLIIWWKTGVVHPRFFLGGAIIFFTIATLMAFAFLVGVVTSSTAVSIMATFAVFFLAAILSGHRQIEAALSAEWAAASSAASTGCSRRRAQLAQATVDFVSDGEISRRTPELALLPVFGRPASSASSRSPSPRSSSGERTSDMRRLALLALAALPRPPAAAARPTDDALALVPPDSVTAGMLRVADLRSSPLAARLFSDFDDVTLDGDAAKFLAEARLNPVDDVDLVVFAARRGRKGRALVAFEGRFDPQRLAAAAAAARRRGRTASGATYFLLKDKGHPGHEGDGAVAFVARLMVAGRGRRREGPGRPAGRRHGLHGRGRPRRAARQSGRRRGWVVIDRTRFPESRARPRVSSDDSGNAARGDRRRHEPGLGVRFPGHGQGDALRSQAPSGFVKDEETRGLLEDALRGLLAGIPARGPRQARGRLGDPEVQGRGATATP